MKHFTLALALLVTACGGPPQAAREVLSVSSHALVTVDEQAAAAYTTTAARALGESATLADYHHRMEPWDAAEQAIRTARSALLACEDAIDAWSKGAQGETKFREAARSLADALVEVTDALKAAGVTIPPALKEASDMSKTWGKLL